MRATKNFLYNSKRKIYFLYFYVLKEYLMKKICFLISISLFLFSSANAFELKGQNTAEMRTSEEVESFVMSLTADEYREALNRLEVRKEDCSLNLIGALHHRPTLLKRENKIAKVSPYTHKVIQHEENCRRAKLYHVIKSKNSLGKIFH